MAAVCKTTDFYYHDYTQYSKEEAQQNHRYGEEVILSIGLRDGWKFKSKQGMVHM